MQDYADGTVIELTMGAAELDPILQSAAAHRQLVLLDFFATWCGPCRMLAPVLLQFAQEFRGRLVVVKLDCEKTAANQALAANSSISAYPTLKLYRNQNVVSTLRGANPSALRQAIAEQLAQIPAEISQSAMAANLAGALRRVKNSCSFDEFQTAAQTLVTYVQNILNHPEDPKYRKIKLSSGAYQSRLGSKAGGKDCLLALGFQETMEAMEPILLMDHVPQHLRSVMRLLDQAMAAAQGAQGSLTSSTPATQATQPSGSTSEPPLVAPPPTGAAVGQTRASTNASQSVQLQAPFAPRHKRVVVTPEKLAKVLERMLIEAGFGGKVHAADAPAADVS